MDCTRCLSKGCRTLSPCVDRRLDYFENYTTEDNQDFTRAASALIDGGRAGTLNRLEEITEFVKLKDYQKIGVAYCFGMEKEATLLRDYLIQHTGLKPVMVSCTVDGIKESELDTQKTNSTVSCNPLGQANILNSSGVEFTILMGLCLGHDILIQKYLTMDFTTFVVKDRVLEHNPILALPGYKTAEDLFVESLPRDFNLIKMDEFITKLKNGKSPEDFYLLDLRGPEVFQENSISGSINCLLNELPERYRTLFPDKHKEIIVYCNGGMQSLYGVMYLALKGYTHVKSLSGGYSKYRAQTV
ncbi:DUF1847 domain-containing protein [Desulfitobacterium metallireducens]|uniref:Rhodanese domain-containing protein n=1 Tax=Desulfitobacterium metallireducens DSM 15288 TaxID=871968 RepID=W0ECS3_9FIRM|nr:DUF1847 domain-containing protein [Desulfitobacterium metallireducens]AHF07004.1 hypothetical protein DESME_07945 [Desulfitobacterium metallireducens DSM 15288]